MPTICPLTTTPPPPESLLASVGRLWQENTVCKARGRFALAKFSSRVRLEVPINVATLHKSSSNTRHRADKDY